MSWVNTNGPKPTFGVSDAAAGFDLHARTLGRHGYRASTSARATRHLRPSKSFGLLRPTTNSLLRCTTAAPTRAFGQHNDHTKMGSQTFGPQQRQLQRQMRYAQNQHAHTNPTHARSRAQAMQSKVLQVSLSSHQYLN